MSYKYEYPHPSVTADIVIFAMHENDLKALLVQRKNPPYKGSWAIPGGFVEIDEDIETGARRELEEETGVKNVFLEQLYTFGAPKRDPRERVITVAYYSLVNLAEHPVTAGSDAVRAEWFPIRNLPKLAFDHRKIMDMAVKRLESKALYAPIIFELLPKKFKLPQLQHVFEVILQRQLDKRNFRKKILSTGMLTEASGLDKSEQRRPAKLYRFDRAKFKKLDREGAGFEFRPGAPRKRKPSKQP
jgi:8-oxo-dGTP diphosphatase